MEQLNKFTLYGEEREGGYMYVTSSDLPGFSFMLEPSEKDVESMLAAIKPALSAYLSARDAKARKEALRPRFTNIRFEGKQKNLVAELCAA
jgi:hypothetical protein